MSITISEARAGQIAALIPVLLQAETSESALRWSLANLSDTIYRADQDGQLVGAATMRWRDDPCELVELAVVPEHQGQGLGEQIVAWLLAEAGRRGKRHRCDSVIQFSR